MLGQLKNCLCQASAQNPHSVHERFFVITDVCEVVALGPCVRKGKNDP